MTVWWLPKTSQWGMHPWTFSQQGVGQRTTVCPPASLPNPPVLQSEGSLLMSVEEASDSWSLPGRPLLAMGMRPAVSSLNLLLLCRELEVDPEPATSPMRRRKKEPLPPPPPAAESRLLWGD